VAAESFEKCLADAKAAAAAQVDEFERSLADAATIDPSTIPLRELVDIEPAEHVVVTKSVVGEVAGVELRVEFIYDTGDPYAVVMIPQARNGGVPWTFSRDVLDEGIVTRQDGATAGDGDVLVSRISSERAQIILDNPNGHAEITVPVGDVLDFLEQAYARVQRGMEQQPVDWFAEYDFLGL
jgi:hypothetical protein